MSESKAKKVNKAETSKKSAKPEKEKIEYHYGFYAAVNFEYEAMRDKMTFLQEYELGDEPVRLDMLIINDAVLTDAIGSFFRKYNVLEYKSPEDSLSIDDFYKVQGYACLYKSSSKKIDEIKIEELTASIFRHTYPVKMFAALERIGFCVKEKSHGIYYVTGALCVPTQVIVTSRLSGGGYEAFKILAKNANKDDILKFLDSADSNSDVNTSAILRVSVAANELLYQKLREENYSMGALDRLLSAAEARGLSEGINIGRSEGINIGRSEGGKIIRERLIKAGINPLDADKYTDLENVG